MFQRVEKSHEELLMKNMSLRNEVNLAIKMLHTTKKGFEKEDLISPAC